MQHLTEEQIARYVERSSAIDELLASAEHLDQCFECRDRAAALADPGIGTPSHTRRKRTSSGPRAPMPDDSGRSRLAAIALAVLTLLVVIAIVYLARH